MAFDEHLAERIRSVLEDKKVAFEEKKMMGGLTFMVRDKMCVGIVKNDFMARVGKDRYDAAINRTGAREMDFTGRPMKGYIFVSPEGIDMDDDLDMWVQECLDFNQELI